MGCTVLGERCVDARPVVGLARQGRAAVREVSEEVHVQVGVSAQGAFVRYRCRREASIGFRHRTFRRTAPGGLQPIHGYSTASAVTRAAFDLD
jgi:hypothetical protein